MSPPAAPGEGLAAHYYDGRSARRHPAVLDIAAGRLRLAGDGWSREAALDAVEISEPLAGAPRTLRLPDGAHCEVPDGPELAALLAAAGLREGRVVKWQARLRYAAAALAGIVALIAAGYVWLLPAAANALAPHVPQALLAGISQGTLQALDEGLLEPSRLAAQRRAAIAGALGQIEPHPGERPRYRLLFRSAPRLGPNAIALPNGDIVLFDQLVALAADDREVAAVLAHELGHVAHRHGVRQLIQSAVVSFLAAAYFGDVSSLGAALASLVLESRYSRGFELEADRYAARALRAAGQSPEALAAMLVKLDRRARGDAGGGVLSTHPDTRARIEALR